MERGVRHGLMNDANAPNIDQRLDRLTERHEALTQTVGLIAAAQLKSDERLEQVTADIAKPAALTSQTDKFNQPARPHRRSPRAAARPPRRPVKRQDRGDCPLVGTPTKGGLPFFRGSAPNPPRR